MINKQKPIFSTKKVKLFLGDTLEVMASFKNESFDLIFADPPYNLSNDGFTCQSGIAVSVNKGKWDKSKGFDEDLKFHEQWIAECHRLLKPNGTIWISGTYHSIYLCGYALQKQGWHLLNDIAWFKPNASPNLSCRMFTASHESILWAKKIKTAKQTFNYEYLKNSEWGKDFIKKPNKQMRSVWVISSTPQSEKTFGKHPTQKPLALLERVILASSKKGDLVLDPFCGSGTTGLASIMHDRVFTGIDSDEKYLLDIASKRLG